MTATADTADCIFCKIYLGKEDADVLYKGEELVIFKDIRPAAEHHYLIVPEEHIRSAKHLTKDHVPLVEKLVRHGKLILEEKGADLTQARFGFHWPPFQTVAHLHLHAISPVPQMSWINKCIFKPGSLWFVTPEYVLQRLAKL